MEYLDVKMTEDRDCKDRMSGFGRHVYQINLNKYDSQQEYYDQVHATSLHGTNNLHTYEQVTVINIHPIYKILETRQYILDKFQRSRPFQIRERLVCRRIYHYNRLQCNSFSSGTLSSISKESMTAGSFMNRLTRFLPILTWSVVERYSKFLTYNLTLGLRLLICLRAGSKQERNRYKRVVS